MYKRAQEISSEHFDKEQSQMLIAVVWYHSQSSTINNSIICRRNYVFTSAYLTHSSLLFQKCYRIFRDILQYLSFDITEEFLLSDGSSQQFKNNNNYFWASNQAVINGSCLTNIHTQLNRRWTWRWILYSLVVWSTISWKRSMWFPFFNH